MNVIVCGGRDFGDADPWEHGYLVGFLDAIDRATPIARLAHGGASGADVCGEHWARNQEGCAVQVYPAKWSGEGRAAGPIRNQRMLDAELALGLDAVIAFPGGKGTADMVRRARAAGVRVIEARGA